MKKLYTLICLVFVLFVLVAFSAQNKQEQTTNNAQIVKQQYKIIEFHTNYVTAESAKYKGELINFYYDDKVKKEKLKLNDTIEAAFQKSHNDYNIIDWYKIKPL
jgi:flagellar basal body-associated protein FliL